MEGAVWVDRNIAVFGLHFIAESHRIDWQTVTHPVLFPDGEWVKTEHWASAWLLPHQRRHNDARNEGQQPNGRDGPGEADDCSEQTSGERTDCVAQVAPEPVDAKGTGT